MEKYSLLPCNKYGNFFASSWPFRVYRDLPFDLPNKSKISLGNNCNDTIVQKKKLRLKMVQRLADG